jgi:hypothetical protein
MKRYQAKIPHLMQSFEFDAMTREQAIAFFAESTLGFRTATLYQGEKRLAKREFFIFEEL